MEISQFAFDNCEIELDLSRSKNCIISEMSRTTAVAAYPATDCVPPTQTTNATFQMNNAKLYVSVVTLSKNGNI